MTDGREADGAGSEANAEDSAPDRTSHGEASLTRLETALVRLRGEEETRWGATAIAVVVGLVLAALHWVGLVVGGALVALPRKRARHAPLAGLGFGAAALVAFVLATPAASIGELLALAPPVYVALGAALVLPVLGSLVRGIV